MPSVFYKLNPRLFEKQLLTFANRKVIESACTPIIEERIEQAQRDLIEEFEEHPVTKEIDNGPTSSNLSGTLGGYGNLFSFIGFKHSEDPISPIRSILKEKPNVSLHYLAGSKIRIKIDNAPDIEEIFKKTPLPWASDSWARRIELGLSGFGYYLNKQSIGSRSNHGFQIENKLRSGRFKNTSYLSKMIKNYHRKLFNKNL